MDKPQEKTTETRETPKGAFPAVPTTKILAIGRFLAPLTPEQRKAILPREVPDTVRLFLAGKIDQFARPPHRVRIISASIRQIHDSRDFLDERFGKISSG